MSTSCRHAGGKVREGQEGCGSNTSGLHSPSSPYQAQNTLADCLCWPARRLGDDNVAHLQSMMFVVAVHQNEVTAGVESGIHAWASALTRQYACETNGRHTAAIGLWTGQGAEGGGDTDGEGASTCCKEQISHSPK